MCAAPSATPPRAAARQHSPGASTPISSFWQRVTEGFKLADLWTQFRSEARVGYGLYSREVDWEAIRTQSRWKRPWRAGRALFWAMIMKLSPARRVLLLLAFVLVLKAVLDIRLLGWPRGTHTMLAAAILTVLLALELADRVAMKRDLEIAREIQRWLLPAAPPQAPGLDLAFATRSANTVGGDYYDAFLRGADSREACPPPLLLVVADVAGKSVPAALLMATFHASLRTLGALPGSLAELVVGLNRYACEHSLGGLRFTTAFFAEREPATRTLIYVNAGHNAPFLRRASGRIERLETGGVPLGIEPGAIYVPGTLTLAPGDVLVVFTDGMVEAVNQVGEEFGERRLEQLLHSPNGSGALTEESALAILDRLMAAVDAFVGSARPHDDITCLVLRAA